MYEILGKFSNNKTSVALLHGVPQFENLQTENLGVCFCLQTLEFTHLLLKLTASNSKPFNKGPMAPKLLHLKVFQLKLDGKAVNYADRYCVYL